MGPALESLIYRNQLVDFTDRSKLIDSTAQLVAGTASSSLLVNWVRLTLAGRSEEYF